MVAWSSTVGDAQELHRCGGCCNQVVPSYRAFQRKPAPSQSPPTSPVPPAASSPLFLAGARLLHPRSRIDVGPWGLEFSRRSRRWMDPVTLFILATVGMVKPRIVHLSPCEGMSQSPEGSRLAEQAPLALHRVQGNVQGTLHCRGQAPLSFVVGGLCESCSMLGGAKFLWAPQKSSQNCTGLGLSLPRALRGGLRPHTREPQRTRLSNRKMGSPAFGFGPASL